MFTRFSNFQILKTATVCSATTTLIILISVVHTSLGKSGYYLARFEPKLAENFPSHRFNRDRSSNLHRPCSDFHPCKHDDSNALHNNGVDLSEPEDNNVASESDTKPDDMAEPHINEDEFISYGLLISDLRRNPLKNHRWSSVTGSWARKSKWRPWE